MRSKRAARRRDERAHARRDGARRDRRAQERQRVAPEPRVHLREERVHVLEVAEHRAEAHAGAVGHLLRRRPQHALADEREERSDDPAPAAFAAAGASVLELRGRHGPMVT